ncbi:TRAP transporter small permease [Marivibrio halodurans]|uniref:TRAP transporter small permease protein n=1 Tax=Marivibrio halodurans TaxID=2039722 RepID=A0A8J7SPV6_9PROT|nr:TRAP transporter small permease [Marivibrio halodurans]MBP5858591.1 TRAP transporter small permease [Marivibrio halodurans]
MVFWKVWDRVLDALVAFSAALVGLMVVGVCADVTLRNLELGGLPWVFDFVEYGILGVTTGMAAYVLKLGRHVEVDLVLMFMPEPVVRVMRTLAMLIVMGASAALCWYAARAAVQAFEQGSMIFRYVLVPEWIPFASVSVMFGTLAIEALRRCFVAGRKPGPNTAF